MRRVYKFAIIVLVGCLIVASHSSAQPYKLADYASEMSVGELLSDTNAQRSAAGESSLNLNSELDSAAQSKANDLVNGNYWADVSPSGATLATFISASGYNYSAAGQNLAYGLDTPSDVLVGWMNSPEHRANILNGGFVDVGFGVENSPNFMGQGLETIVVAEYASPYGQAVAAAPTASPQPGSTPSPSPVQVSQTASSAPTPAQSTNSSAPTPAASSPVTPPPAPVSSSTKATAKKVTTSKAMPLAIKQSSGSRLTSILNKDVLISPSSSSQLGNQRQGLLMILIACFAIMYYRQINKPRMFHP